MIEWLEFQEKISRGSFHTINNNSKKNIVLFGNCHVATIGYILNILLYSNFNIHIIISWYCEKKGYQHFDMEEINNKIKCLVFSSDIFIFQSHVKDYGIDASQIHTFAGKQTKQIQIPNFRLVYNTLESYTFNASVEKLKNNIENSDFPDFIFIINNISNIIFFNTIDHPTHYILFLLSKSIFNKITKYKYIPMTIGGYYDMENKKFFKLLNNYVVLPGKDDITEEISSVTGISINADYFDN